MDISPIKTIVTPLIAVDLAKVITYHTTFILPFMKFHTGNSVSKPKEVGTLGLDSVVLTEGNNLEPPCETWQ
jgi:hypothetical protein